MYVSGVGTKAILLCMVSVHGGPEHTMGTYLSPVFGCPLQRAKATETTGNEKGTMIYYSSIKYLVLSFLLVFQIVFILITSRQIPKHL